MGDRLGNRSGGWMGGLVLILLGVVFLVAQSYPDVFQGWMVVLGVGLLLLVGYLLTRQYGLLIPGCIVGAVGVGIWLTETFVLTGDSEGGAIVLALGVGFLAIWAIDLLVVRGRKSGWWPLIPGGILTVIGIVMLAGQTAWLEDLQRWWPIILIVVGALIVVERMRRQS